MHPIICTIGPATVYSYGLMVVVAFSVASFLATRRVAREGLSPETIFNFSFIIFIFGTIGARLFYVFENAPYYIGHPVEIFMLQKGGLSWYGGFISGCISALIYLKKIKIDALFFLDLIVPFVALGQSLGRIGCFLNGCCYGKPSIFGLYLPSMDAVLIPTQLYSSLALLVIFIVLRFRQDSRHKKGEVFFTYLLLYSIKRFGIEFWRADNKIIFFGLTLFQLISILIFIFAVYKIISLKLTNK